MHNSDARKENETTLTEAQMFRPNHLFPHLQTTVPRGLRKFGLEKQKEVRGNIKFKYIPIDYSVCFFRCYHHHHLFLENELSTYS